MELLDTTFLIDLLRGKQEVKKVLSECKHPVTTQINMFELIRGIMIFKVPQKAIELFDAIEVLPLDDSGIIKAADISATLIKKGKTIPDNDCLIAGIMLSRGITTIVTRDAKHFSTISGCNVHSY